MLGRIFIFLLAVSFHPIYSFTASLFTTYNQLVSQRVIGIWASSNLCFLFGWSLLASSNFAFSSPVLFKIGLLIMGFRPFLHDCFGRWESPLAEQQSTFCSCDVFFWKKKRCKVKNFTDIHRSAYCYKAVHLPPQLYQRRIDQWMTTSNYSLDICRLSSENSSINKQFSS